MLYLGFFCSCCMSAQTYSEELNRIDSQAALERWIRRHPRDEKSVLVQDGDRAVLVLYGAGIGFGRDMRDAAVFVRSLDRKVWVLFASFGALSGDDEVRVADGRIEVYNFKTNEVYSAIYIKELLRRTAINEGRIEEAEPKGKRRDS